LSATYNFVLALNSQTRKC